MNVLDRPILNSVHETLYARLAHTAFLIYVFFMFFGTGLPFSEGSSGLHLSQTSNRVNQLLSLLFLVSLFSLVGKLDQVRALIFKEKFLTLFLIWAFFSVLWSDFTVISLKRWISLVGEMIICLAALIHFKWSEAALRPFRGVMSLYLPLTILAVILVPQGAIQWEFPAWRGLAATKNNLGQVALFSIIILLAIIPYNRKRPINIFHYLLLACAVAAYLGARSTTNFLIGGVLLSIHGALYAGQLLRLEKFIRFFAFFVLLSSLFLGILVVVTAPEILSQFVGIFGKDLTFSGRVDLWDAVLRMSEGKFITGWGIGGFWVGGAPHLFPLFEEFVWLPNQAHQGYIDVYNQLGIVGLGLLVLMIVNYFKGLTYLKKPQLWKWLFIGIVILNMQESVFFRPRHIGHFMFLFSYMALHADILKEKEVKKVEREISDSIKQAAKSSEKVS